MTIAVGVRHSDRCVGLEEILRWLRNRLRPRRGLMMPPAGSTLAGTR